MTLPPDIFSRIVDLLSPHMGDLSSRQALLTQALVDCYLYNQINWSGNAQVFTANLVRQAYIFGECYPEEPAIVSVLKTIKGQVGRNLHLEIDKLIEYLSVSESHLLALLEQARNAYNAGQTLECITYADEVIRLRSTSVAAYIRRGAAKAASDIEGELEDLEAARRLDSESTHVLNNIGVAHMEVDPPNIAHAMEFYVGAIMNDPEHAEAYHNRAVVRAQSGDVNSALADYQQAVRLKPDLAVAYWGLGNCYHQNGQNQEALQSYQRYLELVGNSAHSFVKEQVTRLRSMQDR